MIIRTTLSKEQMRDESTLRVRLFEELMETRGDKSLRYWEDLIPSNLDEEEREEAIQDWVELADAVAGRLLTKDKMRKSEVGQLILKIDGSDVRAYSLVGADGYSEGECVQVSLDFDVEPHLIPYCVQVLTDSPFSSNRY